MDAVNSCEIIHRSDQNIDAKSTNKPKNQSQKSH